MADTSLGPVLRHLRKLLGSPPACAATDARLLEQYACQGDEDAFAELVRRHGPLVWRVCRRVLRHTQQAEEAYQATFLILARRAAKVRKPASLASFLYGVAYRVAHQARADALRRQAPERGPAAAPAPDPAREAAWRELEQILVEEVHALPEKYRVPILLCYWEGRTNEEAAAQLGCPAGTLKTRLLKARRLLHERLTRRGVDLSAGAIVTLFALAGEAAMPPVGAVGLGGASGASAC
jgi:RNA polymerase sigma factor (sigma-70 family)